MIAKWNASSNYSDKFSEILTDARLFQSVKALNMALREYEKELSGFEHNDEEKLKMKLALIWIKLTRGVLDSKKGLEELKEISGFVKKKGNLLESEYQIVNASYILLIQNEYKKAKAILEQVEFRLRKSHHIFLYGLVAKALCNAHIMLGESGYAEEYAQAAISIFRRLGNKMLLASSLNSYAVMRKTLCQYEEAEKLLKQAQKLFKELGAIDGEFLCLNNLAIIKMKSGEWNSAEYYQARLHKLEKELSIKGDNLLIYRINVAHQLLLRRQFEEAKSQLQRLSVSFARSRALKQQVLANEFLGELYTETADYAKARKHLDKARNLAENIAPESDIMTETKRRQAQLYIMEGNVALALEEARDCISLCRKINDKHEMGAALRILGESYARIGKHRKAASTFEASISILKSIHECYELMLSCMTYGKHQTDQKYGNAGAVLFEARHLASELELKYYLSLILILLGRHAVNSNNFAEARVYLRKAEEECENLQECDRKRVMTEIKAFRKDLDQAILSASINAAEKLKVLGKIYEDARFPMEELTPELAMEVAHNVGAESLFLVRKKNSGYQVPVKFNISADSAKMIVRRLENGNRKKLFGIRVPGIYELGNELRLVGVPGKGEDGYILCTLVKGERDFSERELEFLFASVEAMVRLASERREDQVKAECSDFISGKSIHPGGCFSNIITRDPGIIRLIKLAARASKSDASVLLQGETGVGKELFARAIHDCSIRRNKHFIAINTGGIPVNFLESELFGYIKGAYTDARMDKKGLVEEACGGTLFLDEVGEMSEELQVKLLRLLEDGEYRRLGESKLRHADVRIISATNKDLTVLMREGKFREDLYYRLSTICFTISAVRCRRGDIELLVRHFLKESVKKLGQGKRLIDIDVKAMQAFELYNWPGNIRELQNEIMRLVSLMGDGEIIRFGMLSDNIKNSFRTSGDTGLLEKNVERFERRLILRALEENEWNRLKTAEQIGVPRTTLLAKMRKLNITS